MRQLKTSNTKNKIGNHLFLENDNFHKQNNQQKTEANG